MPDLRGVLEPPKPPAGHAPGRRASHLPNQHTGPHAQPGSAPDQQEPIVYMNNKNHE